ncbi:MAG: TraU family protein [Nitrospirae bacterium]|nr:TraU family protein [Nitrospirota bacterium]
MKRILIIFLLISLLVPLAVSAETSMDLLSFLKILDLEQCLLKSYRCIPLGCGATPPLDRICHNVPVGFVETTTAPFATTVPFVGTLLSIIGEEAKLGGAGGSSQQGQANLHYFETHVFNLPTRTFIKLRYPFLKLCSWGSTPWEINYLSEADAVNWRTGIADYASYQFLFGMIAQISQICTMTSIGDNAGDAVGETINIPGIGVFKDICMGTWGVTYPRVGFSNPQSEVVASAIAAYRASRIVARPFARVVFLPKLFDPDLKMQLGYPLWGKPLNCFSKGTTPMVWDNFTTKMPKGAGYIWVLWEKKCCCFPSTGCVGLPPFI